MNMPARDTNQAIVYLFPQRQSRDHKHAASRRTGPARLFLIIIAFFLIISIHQFLRINQLRAQTDALRSDVDKLAAETAAVVEQFEALGI